MHNKLYILPYACQHTLACLQYVHGWMIWWMTGSSYLYCIKPHWHEYCTLIWVSLQHCLEVCRRTLTRFGANAIEFANHTDDCFTKISYHCKSLVQLILLFSQRGGGAVSGGPGAPSVEEGRAQEGGRKARREAAPERGAQGFWRAGMNLSSCYTCHEKVALNRDM